MLHALIASVLETFFSWIWRERKTCSDLSENFFVTKSATDIAKIIRTREVTAYHVVQAYIQRLNKVNPLINAVVDGPFPDEALAEARKIDEKLEKGFITEEEFLRLPFLGVPFSTKDSTAVKGKLQTLGLRSRADVRSDEDANCVRLMKEAGAIIIATTNVPEINRWIESRNNLVGQTNNPYDHRRTAGGSSGGEGAIISSCGSCVGLGTDIGGSIRIPAFYCGVFGHKPTTCAVNTKGCTFRTGDETETMVVAGPMSRYARDLLPMMKVLADPRYEAKLQLETNVDVKKLRYFFCEGLGDLNAPPLSKDMTEALQKVTNHLSQISGNPCQTTKFDKMTTANLMYSHAMSQEPGDYRELLPQDFDAKAELKKICFGKSDYTLALIMTVLAVKPLKNSQEVQKATDELKKELYNFLGDDGVLIFPSSNSPVGFHYSPLFQFYKIFFFSIFNVLRVPVTQVPLGLDSRGLPLGVQVVASPFMDRNCIAVAEELERAFGGWVPPFKIIDKVSKLVTPK